MRLGIDAGNFMTKSSTGFSYQSGMIECVSDPVTSENGIEYDNRFYSIGETRDAMETEKTESENMFLQMLPAIGQAIECRKLKSDQDLELGVGTPLKRFGIESEKYKKYFSGRTFDFKWNGKPYHIAIKRVEVYPQGYAAYLANYKDFSKYPELNVIDIGGGTVDAFMISGGMPITSSFVSMNRGVIILINRCRDDLEPDGISISENQICQSVQELDNQHLMAEQISKICRIQRDNYIRDLLYRLRERGFDFSVPTVFIGGGAMLLNKFWEKYKINTVGSLDANANARAYESLLDRE